MILKSFLVLLLLFLATQVVAWRNMVRGRFALGFLQFAGIFALADILLILHFVVGHADPDAEGRFVAFLWVYWLVALLSCGEYLFHAIRSRRRGFLESQARQYGDALDAFLRGDDKVAASGFRRCCRRDPWDAASALMVGTLLARSNAKGAGRWLRRARVRAADERLRDEIEEELRCLARPRRVTESTERAKKPEAKKPVLDTSRQRVKKSAAG
ncbi:MAG: hypothetical protein KDC95_20685 [Planctomycetes bacterium]|nr:hypothetical protein [Planctomycetota bacterium]